MKYKYKKNQLFGKKLNIPKHILDKVYSCDLKFSEFIEYELDGKIPTSCIINSDRQIIDRFGIEKAKTLDWELINKSRLDNDIRSLLMSIDPTVNDINETLYELVEYKIKPSNYSKKMKEKYSNRLFDIHSSTNDYDEKYKMIKFNDGDISLDTIVSNWDMFKDKDLSYCLLNDTNNIYNITEHNLKQFMSNYGIFCPLIIKNKNIYDFINDINTLKNEKETHEYLKKFTDDILNNTYREYGDSRETIKLTNEEYKEIFKYSSLKNYLKNFNEFATTSLIDELSTLPQDYIFNMPIPFDTLCNYDVLSFIGKYGLKNIVDFDNECGHFFTKNDCEMLKLMNDMYLNYAGNEHDPNKTIFTKNNFDENGNYVDRLYTKDEFYEAMKRMIMYGPSNGDFKDKAPDYREMAGEFRVRNHKLFISDNAPDELRNAFYTKSITPHLLNQHPEYIDFLNDKDLGACFKFREVKVEESKSPYGYENFYNFISSKADYKTVMNFITEYSDILDIIFDPTIIHDPQYELKFSMNDDIEKISLKINELLRRILIEKGVAYPKIIPKKIKELYPSMFLNDDAPRELQQRFYNREFTLDDFNKNLELLEMFGDTNIVCGFPENFVWMIPLFNKLDNPKLANYNRLKVISAYSKIQDIALQNAFKEYIIEFGNDIEIDKIDYMLEVIMRINLSNSSEIFTFRKELVTQILNSNNPLESLSRIENIFIKNNIPTVGKIYSCFEILHPNFEGFKFDEFSTVSPMLKKATNKRKKIIVFSDLIKTFFGSNNRSINSYLNNIEVGTKLINSIKNNEIEYEKLNEKEKQELNTFSKHLMTLYNNTKKGKKDEKLFLPSGNTLNDINKLINKLSPNRTLDYNLADRIVRMFCGFAGIDTLEQAKEYIFQHIENANIRNRNASKSDMVLEKGDLIKGIGDIKYLKNILQNGSVSKEYLGSSAGSDATPLDTDVSMIMSNDGTIKDKINSTAAKDYGPIWFVLKGDERFIKTRTDEYSLDVKTDTSKMELFYTGALGTDHYGIRTGFASSEINYIMMENYDPRVGLEIALNGFYIPVVDTNGKIIFTPKDYDNLREKMNGLSYFDENNYVFSNNLINDETVYLASLIDQSNYETKIKREKINEIIKKSLDELNLQLKTNIDGDLTEGFVELIDTGSTGRKTNKPGDGDFDFMMRLDKSILSNSSKLNELKQTLLKNLGKNNSSEITDTGDFRLKDVQIDNGINVDIDITFSQKTDKVSYSTDMSLQDRLATIERIDTEKYKYVVANILLAKKVLKNAEVYKPNRGEVPQGGLGGVGIENWILQNGGSFIDAATSFVETANGKSFEEFKSNYQIWDFGENHLAEKRGQYAHDNFISNNMSEIGYKKMVQALKEYLNSINLNNDNIKNR